MAMTIQDITEPERRELFGGLLEPTQSERLAREHVRLRYNILHDRVSERDLDQWIVDMYHQPEIAVEVMRHKMRLHNPIKRVVDRLAVLYQRKPTREFRDGEQVLIDESKQWTDALRLMLYDKQMRKLNRYAILANAGVVVLRPRKAGGRTIFDFVPVLKSVGRAVREDGAAMHDAPGILAWLLVDPSEYRVIANASTPVLATADSRWILQWNRKMEMIPELAVEHGLGRFPGATFRNTLPDDSCPLDFWDPWTNSPIVEAQRHVFRIVAEMNWTRKTQAGKLITAVVNDERPHGAKPFAGQVPGDRDSVMIAYGEVQTAVHDLTVLVGGFKEHLDLIQDVAMEILTGTVSTFVAPDPGRPLDPEIAKRMHGALSQHQEDQIDYFELTEYELAEVVAGWGAKLGLELPPVEKVRDQFAIGFAELPALETPMERLALHKERIKLGIESIVDARIEETGESREDAKIEIIRKLEEQAEFNDLRTKRNSAADPTVGDDTEDPTEIDDPAAPGERDEAATGRAGGTISRPPPAQEAAP